MTRPDRVTTLIRKASQDELVLEKLLADSDVDDDTLGFHAQQAAEKLLKALCVPEASITPEPTASVFSSNFSERPERLCPVSSAI